jgi:hypothetical protein
MLKRLTITLSDDVAAWARRRANEKHTSVSKLVGRVLESQMRMGEGYDRAYRRWKRLRNLPIEAANRLSREEAHERRR